MTQCGKSQDLQIQGWTLRVVSAFFSVASYTVSTTAKPAKCTVCAAAVLPVGFKGRDEASCRRRTLGAWVLLLLACHGPPRCAVPAHLPVPALPYYYCTTIVITIRCSLQQRSL